MNNPYVPLLILLALGGGFAVLSATKGWNLAGLKAALLVAGTGAAADLARLPEVVSHGPSHLGVLAHTAALAEGGPWFDALLTGLDAKRALLRLRVLGAALGWLESGQRTTIPRLLGADFTVAGLRTGMERCYRELAHESSGMWERIDLVEKANAIRPRTRV